MNILVNALGIVDSGGVTVLEKLLIELLKSDSKHYIVCTNTNYLTPLIVKFNKSNKFIFKITSQKGFFNRFLYENYSFRSLIIKNNIDLVYNFTGTVQFTYACPQLVKVQNLLFFSKRLDSIYWRQRQYLSWFKQVLLKRLVLSQMLRNAKYIEVQSAHVEKSLSDFINLENKTVFIKSDIDVSCKKFKQPKSYKTSEKINFLYIVGPHFKFIHKNFIDFTNSMLALMSQDVNFEINITLSKEQLINSDFWDNELNKVTNFIGYVDNKDEIVDLFQDNTILISTSIVETIGLHVVEGIQNGVIVIVPHENYAISVYGERVMRYVLFDNDSLLASIEKVIGTNESYSDHILSLQHDLKMSEKGKIHNIMDIFKEILNV